MKEKSYNQTPTVKKRLNSDVSVQRYSQEGDDTPSPALIACLPGIFNCRGGGGQRWIGYAGLTKIIIQRKGVLFS